MLTLPGGGLCRSLLPDAVEAMLVQHQWGLTAEHQALADQEWQAYVEQ